MKLDSKLLFLDIEVTPDLGYAYSRYDADMFEIQRDWYVQSVAWKWANKDKIECAILPDFKGYKRHPYDDTELVKVIWKLLNEAEIVVAHNGDRFDIKKLKTRFILADLDPPRPFKTIDTLKVARNNFGFNSNSLDELGRQMKVGRKLQKSFKGLWKLCEDGDMKAWQGMREYNKHDIYVLERIFQNLLKWIPNFPVVRHDNGKCRKCGGSDFQRRGSNYNKTSKTLRPQLFCKQCGSWQLGSPEKIEWNIRQ